LRTSSYIATTTDAQESFKLGFGFGIKPLLRKTKLGAADEISARIGHGDRR
jgi:hypothetical protein